MASEPQQTTEGLVSLNYEALMAMPGNSTPNEELDMWAQFHKLWSKDATNNASTGYDKKEWLELERRIMVALIQASKRV